MESQITIELKNHLADASNDSICMVALIHTYTTQISNLLEDCTSHELMIITNTIQALKVSLRK